MQLQRCGVTEVVKVRTAWMAAMLGSFISAVIHPSLLCHVAAMCLVVPAAGGCDSLWLAYSSKLDMDHTSKAVANVHRQCLAGSELSFPGQPRLGLAALQALGKLSTLREEVTTRMTDVARQLAELASRQVGLVLLFW